MVRADGTKSAKLIYVIATVAPRGIGTEKDPVREVTQYWDLDGTFLAEADPEHYLPLVEHEVNAIKESLTP